MKAFICALLLATCSLTHADTLPPGPVIGIGTELRSVDHQSVIGQVLPGSPADKAGLRTGDRFLHIDNTNVADLSRVQIAGRLRGAVGSPVQVTVQRGSRQKTYVMKRAILLMPGAHLPQE